MDKKKQLVIPLDDIIKLKENSTKFILKYKLLMSTLALVGLLYYLLENLIIPDDLYFFVSLFKIITTYILPWGIFYCLIKIIRKIK